MYISAVMWSGDQPGLMWRANDAVVGDHVLVGVDHVEVGVGGDAVGDVLEGVGGEGVVVVQEGDVVAGGEVQGGVGGVRRSRRAVSWRVRWMRGSEAAWRSQRGDDLGVGGAVVDQAQLPVGVGLVADGGDRLLEHVQRRVVDGGEHRDQRAGPVRRRRRARVRGCGARRRGGRAGVDERRLHPDRARDRRARRPAARDRVRRESCERGACRPGAAQLHLVAAGRPRSDAASMPRPQLAAAPVGVGDRVTVARTAPATVAPVMGQQHRPAGEARPRRRASADT